VISIVNYQAGNLKSLFNSLKDNGFECCVTEDKNTILESDLAILPGVGAFPDAVEALKKSELWEALKERHDKGKPIMGICLGMQLFYEASEEQVETEGLGFLKGKVALLKPENKELKVPHMGWNTLYAKEDIGYLNSFCEQWVYFVHSYGVIGGEKENQVLLTDYGQEIPAFVLKKLQQEDKKESSNKESIKKGAIIGFQFHPEKSGAVGNELLKRVIDKEVYGV